ncbi:MAG: LEA type 2 family protein [Pseudomonadota bacterium]|nr:LEA type 2 family protein [Pseudomonadota bacterium]
MTASLRQSLCALLVGILLLGGCSQLNNAVKEPDLSLSDIRISDINFDAVTLGVTMTVDNPNAFALALAGYEYRARFNGRELARGSTDQGFRVPARGTQKIEVPVQLTYKEVMGLLNPVGDSGTVSYEIDSKVRLDAPVLNLFSLNSSKSGEITLPRLPKIAFGDLKVKNLSFSEVSVELEMAITNPNSFGVDVKDLDYRFNVGGEQWFAGQLDQSVSLGENQTTRLRIPVKLSLSKLGSGALNAITSGRFDDYSLEGSMRLDSSLPALRNLNIPIRYQP